VTPSKVRGFALGLPGVHERETWGHPTFRVRDRLFVGLAADGRTVSVKSSKEEQAALMAADPATFSPAPYVGRHGWLAVQLERVESSELQELIREAWRRTAPKKLVAEFDHAAHRG
jgi:hypothetical protein